ncbi:peptidyl-tRNA hydrolase ICT1, mitochondrial isoform X1 [Boleophthalmus pectinirostris]|uniref:peptidyl-tRNA hydrolase ICT1, mitochondrial isoform X1 n=1 Tax=Boleophthalmus pectinirostris TaxID=150288 RepID=UPI00242F295E|nr:peptidyl-tRNA hydrolase ICT1, mitochondrial isoform X1 [Boleophthalmus pectinirostris]
MAAHVARQSLLFCFRSRVVHGIYNETQAQGKVVKQISNSFKLCATYGVKGMNPTQVSAAILLKASSMNIVYHVWKLLKERLTVSYSRSSGPGGQHVNKVNTKAEVRFHVQTADWIPEDVRQKILEKNKNRINKSGELLVTSEVSRSQHRNLSDCIQKISDIITEATEKPYEPTAEDIALRAARLEKRNKERLKQKKMASNIKQSRRVGFD